MELHGPVFFPPLQSFKVFLQYEMVIIISDFSVESAVISKQSHTGTWRDVLWKVININQKEQWAKDSTLEYRIRVMPGKIATF